MIRGIKEIIPTNCDVPYLCKRYTRVSGVLTLIKGPVSWSHYIFESWLQRTYMCKRHICVGFLNCVYLLFDTTVWCCHLCNIFYLLSLCYLFCWIFCYLLGSYVYAVGIQFACVRLFLKPLKGTFLFICLWLWPKDAIYA